MEKIEKRMSKYGEYIIDPSLNKYDNIIMNPKKLARVNEKIAKYGLPGDDLEEPFICVKGVLNSANRQTNTFLISEQPNGKATQAKYTISTISETLNDLVKKHWGAMLTVYIKPIPSKSKRVRYELIEVRA